MRLMSGLMRRHGLTFVVAAIAVAALWGVRRGERSAVAPEPSPAQSVALRFAPEARTGSAGSAQVVARQLEQTAASHLTFSPDSLVDADLPDAVVTGRTPEQAVVYAAPALGDGAPGAATTGNSPAAAPMPAAPPINRNAALSDDQIASIKGRLKLTPEQEQYWPPVETALRTLVWRHAHDRRPKAASLDPGGVQKLGSAAGALVAHLTPEQKREVRTLAFLLGLEKLAAQL